MSRKESEQWFHLLDTDNIPAAGTEYNSVNANKFWNGAAIVNPCWHGTESNVRQRTGVNIKVLYACCVCDAALGAGASFDLTLRREGADTTVVIPVIGSAFAGGGSWTGNVNVDAGRLSWKINNQAGTPNAVPVSIHMIWIRNFSY